ncbi:MAG: hypothetical protein M3Y65_24835 [Pseudomonadota bacterium]|nr:hypothetical protein [Pseudomonadota bacterium]
MRIYLTPQKPVVIAEIFNALDMNLLAVPAAGATLTVEWSISSRDDVAAGTALWQFWGPGPVSGAPVSAEFDRQISHLRLTATVGSGVIEYLKLGAI